MTREIGGNIPLTSEDLLLTSIDIRKIFKSNNFSNNLYTFSGRNAINVFLDKYYAGDSVALLPIYTCDSCIRPFAEHNFEIVFYKIKKDLTVDMSDFKKKYENLKNGVVYIQSYFGFDTAHKLYSFLNENKNADNIYIEDLTHAWLGSFASFEADFYVTSYRKWLGIPDGASLSSSKNIIFNDLETENEEEVNDYVTASLGKNKYLNGDDSINKDDFYPLFKKTAASFSGAKKFCMSVITKKILTATNYDKIINIRRKNALYLLENINNDSVELVFNGLNKNEVPLYVPVYLKGNKREDFQKYLMENNIFCPIHWPVSDFIHNTRYYIYSNILSIICDQRYDINDMAYMVSVINSF